MPLREANMILLKKIFRDLRTNRAANIAATILISIALIIYSFMSNVNEVLNLSKDVFYEDSNFADVFSEISSFPREKIRTLRTIEGVKTVDARVVVDFIVKDKESQKLVESKYIRFFAGGTSLCKYIVEKGRRPLYNNEIVIDPIFAEANGYKAGDNIDIIYNGKVSSLLITGIGRSAENIFTTRDASEMLPDSSLFGIGYTDINLAGNLIGDESFNNIIFELEDGYLYSDVKEEISAILKPYGLMRIYKAEDQQSNSIMKIELEAIAAISTSMPVMFLLIAGAIVYIMLKRLVELQRGQIGLLKAFGFSDGQILFHYIVYVSIMGISGAITGAILGTMLSSALMGTYKQFFNMPFVSADVSYKYILISIIAALIFSVITGYLGGRESVKLSPSEAMRPKSPVKFSKKLGIEKSKFVMDALEMTGRIGLRNLGRNKSRGIFIILGVSFTVGICAVPWTLMGQMLPMVYDRYDYVEKYDIKVQLSGFRDIENTLAEIEQNNIKKSEALIEVPVTFRKDNLKKDSILVGLDASGILYTPVDSEKKQIRLKPGQLSITPNIAKSINASKGDYIYMSSPMSKYPEEETVIMISNIQEQLMGSNGYMNLDTLSQIIGYPGRANKIIISSDEESQIDLKEKYIESPYVSGINISDSVIKTMEKMMGLVIIEILYLGIIAVVTGFAITYNSTITVISEREREMTSMMVLGMSEKEVFDIISFEQWVLSIFGMLLGAPLTQFLLTLMIGFLDTDMYYIPAKFDVKFYMLAILITISAVVFGQVAAFRKIKKLNLVDALKSNE